MRTILTRKTSPPRLRRGDDRRHKGRAGAGVEGEGQGGAVIVARRRRGGGRSSRRRPSAPKAAAAAAVSAAAPKRVPSPEEEELELPGAPPRPRRVILEHLCLGAASVVGTISRRRKAGPLGGLKGESLNFLPPSIPPLRRVRSFFFNTKNREHFESEKKRYLALGLRVKRQTVIACRKEKKAIRKKMCARVLRWFLEAHDFGEFPGTNLGKIRQPWSPSPNSHPSLVL